MPPVGKPFANDDRRGRVANDLELKAKRRAAEVVHLKSIGGRVEEAVAAAQDKPGRHTVRKTDAGEKSMLSLCGLT